MSKEEIQEYISIVERALNEILLAERTIDKRKRDKAIRDAKTEAQNLVYPYKALLIDICHIDNLGDELFDWGHLEVDLHNVYNKLKELYKA